MDEAIRQIRNPYIHGALAVVITSLALVVLSIAAAYLGGGWMIPIAMCAAASVGLTLERVLALYVRHNINMDSAVERIANTVQDGDAKTGWKALAHLQKEPIVAVIHGAIITVGHSEKERRRRIEEEVMRHGSLFQRRTRYLSVIANVATLLGLLGTIFGLIACFDAISAADPSQKQALLASGIATAMWTTAFGLIVAIPTLLAHSVLVTQQDALMDRFETASVKLFNLLSGFQLKKLRSSSPS